MDQNQGVDQLNNIASNPDNKNSQDEQVSTDEIQAIELTQRNALARFCEEK